MITLVLSNALSWVKPQGRLVIHGMVSEYDVDVYIKYKPSSHQSKNGEFRTGWNIISQKSRDGCCKMMLNWFTVSFF